MGESVQDTQTMYREEEKLCLKWNDFQENAISAFGTLREDREFADVTLACEDGQQVEAHKVILASSSPFFLNLLKMNKHPHPLIYMRGMKSEDLLAMVDFLYYGEANINQENLESFLAVAEELQLKGLMGSGAEKEAKESYNKPPPKKKTQKLNRERIYSQQEIPTAAPSSFVDKSCYVAKVETSPPVEGTVAVTDYTVAADLQDLDDKIKSMMKFGENSTDGSFKGRSRICKVCGKEGVWSLIRNHIESNHITGVSHTCNICGTVARSKNALSVHRNWKHRAN